MANRTFHCLRLIGGFIVPLPARTAGFIRTAFGSCGWIGDIVARLEENCYRWFGDLLNRVRARVPIDENLLLIRYGGKLAYCRSCKLDLSCMFCTMLQRKTFLRFMRLE